ncbi:MAG: DUF429 domain-containing protein [Candidatus Sulfotelmatobacter sp.]
MSCGFVCKEPCRGERSKSTEDGLRAEPTGIPHRVKIKQVDDAMTPECQQWAFEVHPEFCFWALAGEQGGDREVRFSEPYLPRNPTASPERVAKSGTDIPILLFTLNLSPEIMELVHKAGLRSAISKTEISKIPYAIEALQRGETFFYSK